jgi:hypothetical protein
MVNLKRLDVRGCSSVSDLAPLESMTNLKHILTGPIDSEGEDEFEDGGSESDGSSEGDGSSGSSESDGSNGSSEGDGSNGSSEGDSSNASGAAAGERPSEGMAAPPFTWRSLLWGCFGSCGAPA